MNIEIGPVVDAEKAFPSAIILFSVCAALVYLSQGDWRKVVFWLAAAMISAVVTW